MEKTTGKIIQKKIHMPALFWLSVRNVCSAWVRLPALPPLLLRVGSAAAGCDEGLTLAILTVLAIIYQ